MEWEQLLGFYQVAKLRSFTQAAEATFRTPSSLSRQVKSLEEELNCRLLERIGKRELHLTPLGGEALFLLRIHSNQMGLLQRGTR